MDLRDVTEKLEETKKKLNQTVEKINVYQTKLEDTEKELNATRDLLSIGNVLRLASDATTVIFSTNLFYLRMMAQSSLG